MDDTSAARGRGRPRDATKVEAILEAAGCLFAERGFDGASMEAIAEAAGVAKATIYAKFGDKGALLSALVDAKCAEFLDGATLLSSDGRTTREGLLAIAKRFLALITSQEPVDMFHLVADEGKRNPLLPDLFFKSAILPTKDKVSAFLSAEAARGRLAIADPERAAWQFLSLVKGEDHIRAILNLPRRPQAEMEAYIEDCVDLFLRAHAAD